MISSTHELLAVTRSHSRRVNSEPQRLLVALTKDEIALFFPRGFGGDWSTPLEWYSAPEKMSCDAWKEMLGTVRPHIILGGWKMPEITYNIIEFVPEFAYLCYVTGTVREKIDRRFLERGGVISNWGDEAAPSVAECALMLTLMALRQATRYALDMHVLRIWPEIKAPRPLGLFDRKVGIHGFGSVACAILPMLRPFNVQIEAWSAPVPPAVFREHGVRQAESAAALYRENDIVILAEGLTPETVGSVSREILLGMKPGSAFINVARGAIVDEDALHALAARGDVQLGLDVFATEPLPANSPLRSRPNVSLLPHTAGPTIDRYPACGTRALRNLDLWLRGQTPEDLVTLQRYDVST